MTAQAAVKADSKKQEPTEPALDRACAAFWEGMRRVGDENPVSKNWHLLPEFLKQPHRECMRRAPLAIREPTDAMNDAGADRCDGDQCQCGFMTPIWQAMIDAAITGKSHAPEG
jgi:hypothetical protein